MIKEASKSGSEYIGFNKNDIFSDLLDLKKKLEVENSITTKWVKSKEFEEFNLKVQKIDFLKLNSNSSQNEI